MTGRTSYNKEVRKWLWLLSCLLMFSITPVLHAQELKAKVVVNTAQLSNTKTEVFDALREKTEAFLNDHQWTSLQFKENEKIDCNFNITVNSWDESEGMIKSALLMTCSRLGRNSQDVLWGCGVGLR